MATNRSKKTNQQEQVEQDQQNYEIEKACLICGWTPTKPWPRQQKTLHVLCAFTDPNIIISNNAFCEHQRIEFFKNQKKLQDALRMHITASTVPPLP